MNTTFFLFYESNNKKLQKELDRLFRIHGLPTVILDNEETIETLVKQIKEHTIHKEFVVKKIFYTNYDELKNKYHQERLDDKIIQKTAINELQGLWISKAINVHVDNK